MKKRTRLLVKFSKEVEMAEYHGESPEVIAKEITLAAMEKVLLPGDRTPEKMGDLYGKLYKTILKHIREAVHKEKYD